MSSSTLGGSSPAAPASPAASASSSAQPAVALASEKKAATPPVAAQPQLPLQRTETPNDEEQEDFKGFNPRTNTAIYSKKNKKKSNTNEDRAEEDQIEEFDYLAELTPDARTKAVKKIAETSIGNLMKEVASHKESESCGATICVVTVIGDMVFSWNSGDSIAMMHTVDAKRQHQYQRLTEVVHNVTHLMTDLMTEQDLTEAEKQERRRLQALTSSVHDRGDKWWMYLLKPGKSLVDFSMEELALCRTIGMRKFQTAGVMYQPAFAVSMIDQKATTCITAVTDGATDYFDTRAKQAKFFEEKHHQDAVVLAQTLAEGAATGMLQLRQCRREYAYHDDITAAACILRPGDKPPAFFFAVYDGQGGPDVARIVRNIHKAILKNTARLCIPDILEEAKLTSQAQAFRKKFAEPLPLPKMDAPLAPQKIELSAAEQAEQKKLMQEWNELHLAYTYFVERQHKFLPTNEISLALTEVFFHKANSGKHHASDLAAAKAILKQACDACVATIKKGYHEHQRFFSYEGIDDPVEIARDVLGYILQKSPRLSAVPPQDNKVEVLNGLRYIYPDLKAGALNYFNPATQGQAIADFMLASVDQKQVSRFDSQQGIQFSQLLKGLNVALYHLEKGQCDQKLLGSLQPRVKIWLQQYPKQSVEKLFCEFYYMLRLVEQQASKNVHINSAIALGSAIASVRDNCPEIEAYIIEAVLGELLRHTNSQDKEAYSPFVAQFKDEIHTRLNGENSLATKKEQYKGLILTIMRADKGNVWGSTTIKNPKLAWLKERVLKERIFPGVTTERQLLELMTRTANPPASANARVKK